MPSGLPGSGAGFRRASRCAATPPFGLRFYSRGRLICEASVCWECNNIFGNARGEHLWYGFDASHEHSRELLAACKRAIGRAGADVPAKNGN